MQMAKLRNRKYKLIQMVSKQLKLALTRIFAAFVRSWFINRKLSFSIRNAPLCVVSIFRNRCSIWRSISGKIAQGIFSSYTLGVDIMQLRIGMYDGRY